MHSYSQSTGIWYDPVGKVLGIGWAGQGVGKNNPNAENVHGIGPLPKGIYTITAPYNSLQTGPYTLGLVPDPKNVMYQRGGFRVHGFNAENPELSSEGCIIQIRKVRETIWAYEDKLLQVVG